MARAASRTRAAPGKLHPDRADSRPPGSDPAPQGARFLLREQLETIDHLSERIRKLDARIEAVTRPFASAIELLERRKKKSRPTRPPYWCSELQVLGVLRRICAPGPKVHRTDSAHHESCRPAPKARDQLLSPRPRLRNRSRRVSDSSIGPATIKVSALRQSR